MQLSSTQLADYLEPLLMEKLDNGTQEHRRAQRVHQRLCLKATFRGERLRRTVHALNYSPRGIALLLDENFNSGDQFVLHLQRKSGEPADLLCSIVHCKKVGPRMFKVGAEFTCLVPTSTPGVAKPSQATSVAKEKLAADEIRKRMMM